ncbi:DNA repair helicase XPB [Tuwongella immobilis]|uniref:DNA 3'-5' helicase n=1 Tax=Tuwongella immobilis TaxID=692036 RepID=A0A6C2YLX3_9BACT|nr:DNA repair helicase XPB [Tuwongella immobilis]VIP02426.1 type iii restriction protein res subunit : DNA/RNA helicase, superfamily II OS=Singulisphaera acidiphila (strain ATCC BAA-1392 / DSM 18658 / VKM B-2454 / MOB10) GN=Sinac_6347 PE=4 SV=1: Helicase_C_3: ResIII: Helicase_C [Tuwongella immobilis]VTS01362.1 type iii restriction protein res subunit : DNA/RNA helicase, superfamily II OS=Singulisphaera acidiphila (strain ATCC BAA-1392 / DSM 18658 / VKM B-2454 / MOB10) GN=Sinac_6347 PE=4 SV=1: Hel
MPPIRKPVAASPTTYDPTNPLIVQGDRSVLVEVDNPRYEAARDALAPFAELEKSPEHIHTYRISNLSLWNAAAAGITAEQMLEVLHRYTKFPIPANLATDLTEVVSRYGRVRLERIDEANLKLVCEDPLLLDELTRQKKVVAYLGERIDKTSYTVAAMYRGVLKQALIVVGYPAEDLAGYTDGAPLPMLLRGPLARSGMTFAPRDYQREAANIFYAGGDVRGGSGVIVLPCGAGKTIVGITAMTLLKRSTLVLTTSVTSVKQWRREILDKTDLADDMVAEYTGETKDIAPVTLATYQIVTYRPDKTESFPHFKLFEQQDWGLIVYDEVHLLPAPVFRVTAEIQARRRLGLTATLVREDGRESDVFTLIGPKKYDVPWRELEHRGWIATATCTEIRLPLPEDQRREYAVAELRNKYRIASENTLKDDVIEKLLEQYSDQRVLIIGQYLTQLRRVSERFEIPLITGQTSQADREVLYNEFRTGKTRHLVLSKVGNFAIDLPDANVLIQISGTFGSRQEEAQRLGRILRPKSSNDAAANFYTLVSRDTREQDFAQHRQMFLTEQGYSYDIQDASEYLSIPQQYGVAHDPGSTTE